MTKQTELDAQIAALKACVSSQAIRWCLSQTNHTVVSDVVLCVRVWQHERLWAILGRDVAAERVMARSGFGEIMSLRSPAPPGKVLVRVEDDDHFTYFYADATEAA